MKTAERVSAKDLRGTDIFAGLSADDLERIAGSCSWIACQPGEYCALEDETIRQLLIVAEGKVTIEMRVVAPPHTQTVTIATLTKGKVCAWSALVPPHVLTASIRCTEKTRMIGIEALDLQRIFGEAPLIEGAVMKNLAGIISSRLKEGRAQLKRLVGEVIRQGK